MERVKVAYLPLEPYVERYTETLLDWTQRAAVAEDVELAAVLPPGDSGEPRRIREGEVLDSVGRSTWSLAQVAELLRRMDAGEAFDAVLVEDMFTPGIEGLLYYLARRPADERPVLAARNYAQSVDVYDFTRRMLPWMGHYERMVESAFDLILSASGIHAEHMAIAGWNTSKIAVVGLPFDADDVRRRAATPPLPWSDRAPRVVYSSRFDAEKQPRVLLAIARRLREVGIQVVACTGAGDVRSNDADAARAVREAARDGVIELRTLTTKAELYGLLATSRCHLNTSLQDYVSFTLLEASALGCATVAPCFRSFPEAMPGATGRLYVPFDVDDAVEACLSVLGADEEPAGVGTPALRSSRAIAEALRHIQLLAVTRRRAGRAGGRRARSGASRSRAGCAACGRASTPGRTCPSGRGRSSTGPTTPTSARATGR